MIDCKRVRARVYVCTGLHAQAMKGIGGRVIDRKRVCACECASVRMYVCVGAHAHGASGHFLDPHSVRQSR